MSVVRSFDPCHFYIHGLWARVRDWVGFLMSIGTLCPCRNFSPLDGKIPGYSGSRRVSSPEAICRVFVHRRFASVALQKVLGLPAIRVRAVCRGGGAVYGHFIHFIYRFAAR